MWNNPVGFWPASGDYNVRPDPGDVRCGVPTRRSRWSAGAGEMANAKRKYPRPSTPSSTDRHLLLRLDPAAGLHAAHHRVNRGPAPSSRSSTAWACLDQHVIQAGSSWRDVQLNPALLHRAGAAQPGRVQEPEVHPEDERSGVPWAIVMTSWCTYSGPAQPVARTHSDRSGGRRIGVLFTCPPSSSARLRLRSAVTEGCTASAFQDAVTRTPASSGCLLACPRGLGVSAAEQPVLRPQGHLLWSCWDPDPTVCSDRLEVGRAAVIANTNGRLRSLVQRRTDLRRIDPDDSTRHSPRAKELRWRTRSTAGGAPRGARPYRLAACVAPAARDRTLRRRRCWGKPERTVTIGIRSDERHRAEGGN